MMKAISKGLIITGLGILIFAGYLIFPYPNQTTGVAVAGKPVYTGTLYVAGMGGHFARVRVEIDPANTEGPIKISSLDRVVLGTKKTHPTHDARIDANNRNIMFWSTYKLDNGKVHVGKTDLTTGEIITERSDILDPRAKWTGALYCASGQTKSSFIPLTMTDEAYIDIFDKNTFGLKHRIFLDELGYKDNYKFFHGTNTPDMKKFLVVINRTTDGRPNGNIDLLMLDSGALEGGKIELLSKNTITGEPGKTLTFRQYFTEDGKYILQSGADRFFLINAQTLKLIDEEMMKIGTQSHDAKGTPDSNYAILTLRKAVNNSEGKKITDGMVQLYDIKAKKVVGKPVSVCNACHEKMGFSKSAILCGLDANWD